MKPPSTTDLMVTARQEVDFTSAQTELERIKAEIESADAERLAEIRAMVEIVQNALRRQKGAEAAARDAAEARIRAERRLGQVAYGEYAAVASIPAKLFEQVIAEMLAKNSACLPQHVIGRAQMTSLKRLEAGIWQAYDGTFFIEERWQGDRRNRKVRSLAPTLSAARDQLQDLAGLRKKWGAAPAFVKIEDAHARARRLAQQLELLGQMLSGEPRRLIGEAELLEAKVAALLFEAHQASVVDGSWRKAAE